MVACRSSVKGSTQALLLSVRAAGQVQVENHFIAQWDTVQVERPVPALGRIEIADNVVKAKSLPLIELEREGARRGRGHQQPAAADTRAMSDQRLYERSADADRARALLDCETLELERALIIGLDQLRVADDRAIDPRHQDFSELAITGDLGLGIVGLREQGLEDVARPLEKRNLNHHPTRVVRPSESRFIQRMSIMTATAASPLASPIQMPTPFQS